MSMILKRGKVPPTPHTEFYGRKGVFSLEEIHGTYGFSGAWSRKLHLRSYPTEMAAAPKASGFSLSPKAAQAPLQPFHIPTGKMPYGGDPIRARKALVFGPNLVVSVSKPVRSMPKDSFFRNGDKHEAYYVQEGEGSIATEYGDIAFRPGLYVIVPKGTTYRINLKSKKAFFLLLESDYPVDFPARYMNPAGQATNSAPVVETEIEPPVFKDPIDRRGKYPIDVKHAGGQITRLTLGHHPFDLVGWEGALYPFGFHISNHHGITREIHTAPPVHQTFESGRAPDFGFSICSFIAQMEGWHPKEVPAPYAHYNVDSDEVMFFSNASYGARKGVIDDGAFTFHPAALPHSPHGQAALRSTAARGKMNRRRAVMVDTFFEKLQITDIGFRYRDRGYPMSWHNVARSQKGTPKKNGLMEVHSGA